MRVISGKVRGLKLKSPDGIKTRPTLDRVKEAEFSMLMPYLIDAVVLDLFAGSGALGIESLSRGSKKAFFVDISNNSIECIKHNVSNAGFDDVTIITKDSADNFLRNTKEKFDIIFLDPPYEEDMYNNIINIIDDFDILKTDGIIVAEWDYDIGFSYKGTTFVPFKEKKYGRVGVTILKKDNTLL